MASPPVSILIPAHPSEKSKKFTAMCLEAIDMNTDKEKTPYEIIIETEGSFTEAVNSLCKKAKYERIVYIANDIIVVPHWLEIMHASWDALEQGKKRIGQLGTYFTLGGGNWQDAAQNRFRPGVVEECPKFVWMVTMMDKKVFEELGMMDTGFGGAWSDTDISARFLKAGRMNYIAPFVMLHFLGASWDNKWDKAYLDSVKGEKLMRAKHGKDWKNLFGLSA